MAYDIFYIKEISPSLPTTYTFNPMTRSQSRLFLSVRAAVPSSVGQPSSCQDGLELPGPEEGTARGWRWDCWLSPSNPGARTASGFSVPLGLVWHGKDLSFHGATSQPCT